MNRPPDPVPSADAPVTAEGERALWLRVVLQALEDACDVREGRCEAGGVREQQAAQARAWLSVDNSDFRWVCTLAGLDPAETEAAARRTIDSGATAPEIRRRLWLRVDGKRGHGGRRGSMIAA